jgi:hypothetical protein
MLPEELKKMVEAEAIKLAAFHWPEDDVDNLLHYSFCKDNFIKGCEFMYQHLQSPWIEALEKISNWPDNTDSHDVQQLIQIAKTALTQKPKTD